MKRILISLVLLLLPINIMAYSDKVILGGKTVGIEVKSDGILVVGFYKINGKYNKGNFELKEGDYITHINGVEINTLSSLTNEIEKNIKDKKVEITFRRKQKDYQSTLNLIYADGNYKTGLYVKDNILGIGTLTYIDPATNIFGALGHEIIESNTNKIVEIKVGNIFKNSITSIDKSSIGDPGSKNAKFHYKNEYGKILENTKYGIYGKYTAEYAKDDLIPVANPEEVKIGSAFIYTVLEEEEVESFKINITKIDMTSDVKNITFKIEDDNLISKAGGIVQGMSGSPIIQNNKIIGAVTHVIVDNPTSGYGLFITKMLKEGEN